MIVFAPQNVVALQLMPDAGGTAQPLTRFEKGEASQRWPEFLPGGKAVLFAAGANALSFNNAQVAVQSVVTGERRNLIQGAYPRYAPSGHLVYGQRGSLMPCRSISNGWGGDRPGGPYGRRCPASVRSILRCGPVDSLADWLRSGCKTTPCLRYWSSKWGHNPNLAVP